MNIQEDGIGVGKDLLDKSSHSNVNPTIQNGNSDSYLEEKPNSDLLPTFYKEILEYSNNLTIYSDTIINKINTLLLLYEKKKDKYD